MTTTEEAAVAAAAAVMAPPSPTTALPTLAEGFLTDVLEYHSDMLLQGCDDDECAQDHWASLQYFWRLYTDSAAASVVSSAQHQAPDHHKQRRSKFGRISNRKSLAQIIVTATLEDAYAVDHETSEYTDGAMITWDRKQWQWLTKRIANVRKSLMRVDAALLVANAREERCAIDVRRLSNPLFNKRFDKVMQLLKVNELLSLIRRPIYKSYYDNMEQEPDIPQAVLREFRGHVDAVEQTRIRHFLEQFVAHPTEAAGNFRLTPVQELKEAILSDGCNLQKLQGKITSLVREWYDLVFKKRLPALRRLGYGQDLSGANMPINMPVSSTTARRGGEVADENHPPAQQQGWNDNNDDDDIDDDNASEEDRKPAAKKHISPSHAKQQVRDMRHARRDLHWSFRDPLPDSIAAAERATGTAAAAQQQRRSSSDSDDFRFARHNTKNSNNKRSRQHKHQDRDINQRRNSAQVLKFDDSEEEYEAVQGRVFLSDLPSRSNKNNRRSSPERRDTNESEPYVSPGDGKRRRFTPEEKRAIRKGVESHGMGQWTTIKADYAIILRHRTNVQIKDCYRTMKKNGQV